MTMGEYDMLIPAAVLAAACAGLCLIGYFRQEKPHRWRAADGIAAIGFLLFAAGLCIAFFTSSRSVFSALLVLGISSFLGALLLALSVVPLVMQALHQFRDRRARRERNLPKG